MIRTVIDLNKAIACREQLFRRQLGPGIALQITPAIQPLGVGVDETLAIQIVTGLLAQVRKNLAGGGIVTMQTEQFEVDETHARILPGARRGEFVRLTIGDNGPGWRPASLRRLLEQMPAEEIKDVLALPVIAEMLKRQRGWLEAVSQEGCGTVFRVYWPTVAVDPRSTEMHRSNDTILLVDDETAVRRMVKSALQRADYEVIEAENGVQALAIWETHRDRVNLLFTDMVMPEGVTGRDLAHHLKQSKPGLNVIYTSGYELDAEALQETRTGGMYFLHKPYDMRGLLDTVRAALSSQIRAPGTSAMVIAT